MQITRRTALAAGLSTAAAIPASRALGETGSTNRRRVLRVAHLTDAHVLPGKGAGDGLAMCLEHAQDKGADFIIFGGDNVMNVDGDGRETAAAQLDVFKGSVKHACSKPHHCVIGNHDILRLDPVDGKKWATDAFGLDNRYGEFAVPGSGSWQFIALDSTSPEGGGYKGRFDDEQLDWLERTLRDVPEDQHVCIVSHIPILAACVYFDGENEKSGNWRVPGAWMHIDARRLKDLFLKHPQVKLCLSGHIHLVDVVDYLGVRYACNGAVSGGWWRGDYHEFAPGYALVDLFDDGSSEIEFFNYGWVTRE